MQNHQVRKSTMDTKPVTVAVTITASSVILPAVVVFKGEQNRQIAKDEFKMFLKDHFYACQKMHGWMSQS
jgi:hypothetical protein